MNKYLVEYWKSDISYKITQLSENQIDELFSVNSKKVISNADYFWLTGLHSEVTSAFHEGYSIIQRFILEKSPIS